MIECMSVYLAVISKYVEWIDLLERSLCTLFKVVTSVGNCGCIFPIDG